MAIPWPAENARLLEVAAPGAQDDYGDVAAGGAAIWSGDIGAVLKRERSRKVTSLRADVAEEVVSTVETDVLVVRKPPAAIAELTPGDQSSGHTVLVEDRRVLPYTQTRWHVVDVSNRATGHEADSLRLVLHDPRPEA